MVSSTKTVFPGFSNLPALIACSPRLSGSFSINLYLYVQHDLHIIISTGKMNHLNEREAI